MKNAENHGEKILILFRKQLEILCGGGVSLCVRVVQLLSESGFQYCVNMAAAVT